MWSLLFTRLMKYYVWIKMNLLLLFCSSNLVAWKPYLNIVHYVTPIYANLFLGAKIKMLKRHFMEQQSLIDIMNFRITFIINYCGMENMTI